MNILSIKDLYKPNETRNDKIVNHVNDAIKRKFLKMKILRK